MSSVDDSVIIKVENHARAWAKKEDLMKKALIFWGGWEGHEPQLVANRFKRLLEKNGFAQVEVFDNLDCLFLCHTSL